MGEKLDRVLSYHNSTKHHLRAYAKGPGFLDWATQPDPFRRYEGAPVVPLVHLPPNDAPSYDRVVGGRYGETHPVDLEGVSRLFFDSLALSAWKQAGGERWPLRVNPSSGNLHPTEGYLICGPVEGLTDEPAVFHYTPLEHALERRTVLPLAFWNGFASVFPDDSLLVGLTAIHWREAWKYGERAFRYCHLDAGHAIAALGLAAAGLGWRMILLDGPGHAELVSLFGTAIDPGTGSEPEHPDCVLAAVPREAAAASPVLPAEAFALLDDLEWKGTPSLLSSGQRHWPALNDVARATLKPFTVPAYEKKVRESDVLSYPDRPGVSFRRILHSRRSAVEMDPSGEIEDEQFYRIISRTVPSAGSIPFEMLPWEPHAHLVLFVHRVAGLASGLYVLVRDPAEKEKLAAAFREEFEWKKPSNCPGELELYRLSAGDMRDPAKQLSCHQDIASDGCFSAGMIVRFEEPLRKYGPWFYPRLYWECGMIGQILYLEAEACGVRGTGIGCFFDDAVHSMLGLKSESYQSLYHFTVGKPIEDMRITTFPAYP